ncbi:uncharacterized protein LOC144742461 [Ciona intestinalis]
MVPVVPENPPTPAPTEPQPAPVAPAPIAPPSSFTAVTPSGEEASIATLRQKQAARRAKALLFLNAKKKLQEQENGSKGTPERNITTSAATEDIFDLSNPSSPATVDSPSRTAEKEGEVPRPKRTSRFDILPRGMTSLPLAVTQHPVINSGLAPGYLNSRHDVTKTSRDVTPVSTRSDDGEVPSAYRVENEPARRSRERDRRKSSRSSSRRHKHRNHDYRRHSDDDRSPSNHRSSRRQLFFNCCIIFSLFYYSFIVTYFLLLRNTAGTRASRNHVTVVRPRRGKKRKRDENPDQNRGVLLIDHHPRERKVRQSIPRVATERSHVEGHQKTQVTSHPPIVQEIKIMMTLQVTFL